MSKMNIDKIFLREKKKLKDSKVDTCILTMRSLRDLAEKEAKLVHQALKDMENNLVDPGYILDLTKSIHISGNKNISDYINRNIEILLNEHSSTVRQKVIQKMKQQIENSEMADESQKLSEDVENFFKFIQTNYEAASASFQKVLQLAKNNYEKMEQVNEMENELLTIQNEVQELEQQLLECLMCLAFLNAVAPEEHAAKAGASQEDFLRSFGPKLEEEDYEKTQQLYLEDVLADRTSLERVYGHEDLLKLKQSIEHFKDSNLALMHTIHSSKFSSDYHNTHISSIEKEEEFWDAKIANVEDELNRANKTTTMLHNQIRDLSVEDAQNMKPYREKELKKISEIYKLFTGSDANHVELTLMKATIDNSMEKLLIDLEWTPRRKVKELLKVLDAEKKLSERKAEETFRSERKKKTKKREVGKK